MNVRPCRHPTRPVVWVVLPPFLAFVCGSSALGGFTSTLENGDEFGSAVAELGDLDGDGVTARNRSLDYV